MTQINKGNVKLPEKPFVFLHPSEPEPHLLCTTIAKSPIVPSYYPINLPTERIPIEYEYDKEWTLPKLASVVYSRLKTSTVPSAAIQVAFLVELIKTYKFKLSEDWKVGAFFEKEKGTEVVAEDFFQFIPCETSEKLPTITEVVGAEKYLGIAAWVLIQERLSQDNRDAAQKYSAEMLRKLRSLTSTTPLNIKSGESQGFPKNASDFSESIDDRKIKNLAAVYDYMCLLDPSSLTTKIRYCTIPTRFEDQSGLKYINKLAEVFTRPITDVLQLFILLPVAQEAKVILTPGMGIDDPRAFAPYARSLDLVDKSVYSTTNNPHFCTTCAVLLAITSRPSYLHTTKVQESIDDCITLAIKMARGLGSRTEMGRYIQQDSEEVRKTHLLTVASRQEIPLDHLIAQIMSEMKAQGGKPTAEELTPLVNLAKSLQDRPGTLQSYIKTMTPYMPPPSVGISEDQENYPPDAYTYGTQNQVDEETESDSEEAPTNKDNILRTKAMQLLESFPDV